MTSLDPSAASPFKLVSTEPRRRLPPFPTCMGRTRPPDDDLLDMPVAALELPVRLRSARLPCQVVSIRDLLSMDPNDLIQVRNVGRVSISQIATSVFSLARMLDVIFDLKHPCSDGDLILDYAATLFVSVLGEDQLSMMCARSQEGRTLQDLGDKKGLTRQRAMQIVEKGRSLLGHESRMSLAAAALGRLGLDLRRAYSLDVLGTLPRVTLTEHTRRGSPRVAQLYGASLTAYGEDSVLKWMGLVRGEWSLLHSDVRTRDIVEGALKQACEDVGPSEMESVAQVFVDALAARLSPHWGLVRSGVRARHLLACLKRELGWEEPSCVVQFIVDILRPGSVNVIIRMMGQIGEPVHFERLAVRISRSVPEAFHMNARTVHGNLNRRKDLFARVAQGTYALREQGYENVPEIADYLRGAILHEGRPMHFGELVNRAIEDYGFKEKSIRMTLEFSGRFAHLGGGFYDLGQEAGDGD